MIDEKDLEIARLKGQVEALERVIAAMRALMPSFPVLVPTVNPYPVGPAPLWPDVSDHVLASTGSH